MPPSTSSRGDKHRVGRGDPVPQQGRQAQGEGDPPQLPADGAGGKGRPCQPVPGAQIAPEEDRLGEGRGHLTQGHAQDDSPHRLLRGGGNGGPHQGQHQHRPEDLLDELRQPLRGTPDRCRKSNVSGGFLSPSAPGRAPTASAPAGCGHPPTGRPTPRRRRAAATRTGPRASSRKSFTAWPRTWSMTRWFPRAWYQADRLETPVVSPTEVKESSTEYTGRIS